MNNLIKWFKSRYTMQRMECLFVDVVNGEEVFKYKDCYGKFWQAHHNKWGFRVALPKRDRPISNYKKLSESLQHDLDCKIHELKESVPIRKLEDMVKNMRVLSDGCLKIKDQNGYDYYCCVEKVLQALIDEHKKC